MSQTLDMSFGDFAFHGFHSILSGDADCRTTRSITLENNGIVVSTLYCQHWRIGTYTRARLVELPKSFRVFF